MLAALLERGRRDGVFRAGIDPVELYIAIAAQGYFYLSNQHTLSAVLGRDLRAAAATRRPLGRQHRADRALRRRSPGRLECRM